MRRSTAPQDRAYESAVSAKSCLMMYFSEKNKIAESTEEIGIALKEIRLKDGWENDCLLAYEGNGMYSLVSLGKDGLIGTADDRRFEFSLKINELVIAR